MSKNSTSEPPEEIPCEEPIEEIQPAESPDPADCAPAEEDSTSRELLETRDQLLRIAAEYDNFRKRTSREREAQYGNTMATAISLFLPVLDNLERAETAPTTDPSYAQGIALITKQFVDILAKAGVKEIEALGKPFDTNLHEAVMHIEQEDAGESEVVEVFQKGYKMGDRVIRHSVVKVAN